MNGPTAPKDAAAHRPYFYIMQGKEVFGQDFGTGKFFHPIYENDGRLISSARITGNITDEAMLDMLKTAEGFRKLVHSIGISIEADNPDEMMEFVFQMYGKTDVYGGGTNLTASMKADGVETRINVADFPKTEDENIPGQIRFVFEHKGMLARVNVRFFLNDGFTAPEPVEDNPVDVTTDAYKEMISHSLYSRGNLARLKKAITKAQKGEDVTLGYIGGSITQGAGATPINTECYAYKSFKRFCELTGAGDNAHYVKAGVGGTPSELGMLRFERDILADGKVEPDIVVIEFAVNDEGDETKGKCFESLVKKALKLPNKPAVIILFAVFANDWNLQDRLSPVGYKYEVPMVSVLDAVSPQFPLKPEEGRVVSKNRFFYDCFHPTNIGHTIMADCLAYMMKQAMTSDDTDNTDELLKLAPAIGNTFEDVRLLDKKDTFKGAVVDEGSFTSQDKALQAVEMNLDLTGTGEFPYNWMYDGTCADGEFKPFRLEINCKSLVIIFKDSGELDVGRAIALIDGEKEMELDPHRNGWVHCNPVILTTGDETKKHVVTLSMKPGDEGKKFTILGFGYVE